MRWLIHHGKRVLRITAGVALILIAALLGFIPGIPGWPLALVGLSILAVDFVWARRLKRQIKSRAGRALRKVRGQPDKRGMPAEKV